MEYERLQKEIETIRTEEQVGIVRQKIAKAEENDRITHAQHQELLTNLLKKDDELRMFDENVRQRGDEQED